MTNPQIAATILCVYVAAGLLIAMDVMDSKKFKETFNQMSMSEQGVFLVITTLL